VLTPTMERAPHARLSCSTAKWNRTAIHSTTPQATLRVGSRSKISPIEWAAWSATTDWRAVKDKLQDPEFRAWRDFVCQALNDARRELPVAELYCEFAAPPPPELQGQVAARASLLHTIAAANTARSAYRLGGVQPPSFRIHGRV
jgi:hypothetical protein